MDVLTLVEMLEYTPNSSNAFKFKAESTKNGVSRFNPDVPDFAVDAIKSDSNMTLTSVDSAAIIIVTNGSATLNGMNCDPGTVLYSSCNESIEIKITKGQLVAYRAFVA
jgi:mannose-6-phosphate isomerase class I